jgi:hypothetical protein
MWLLSETPEVGKLLHHGSRPRVQRVQAATMDTLSCRIIRIAQVFKMPVIRNPPS